MPKLNKKQQKAVSNADAQHGGGGFELIPAGKYLATLTAVTDGTDNFGNDRWEAEFSTITSTKDGKVYPGRQWMNLEVPQDPEAVPSDYKPRDPKKGSSAEQWAHLQTVRNGRIRAFFESFGYTVDTDTDEMVEEEAKALITIGQRTRQQGDRKGERFNLITGIDEVPEDLDVDDLVDTSGDADDF